MLSSFVHPRWAGEFVRAETVEDRKDEADDDGTDADVEQQCGAALDLAEQRDGGFDDDLVEDYFSYYYRYVMSDEPTRIDAEYAAGGVAHLFDTKGPYGELMKQLNVPPSFVVVQRITLGLMGLFARLDAEANWQAIARELWPFAMGAPSTAMGHEIAAWEKRAR